MLYAIDNTDNDSVKKQSSVYTLTPQNSYPDEVAPPDINFALYNTCEIRTKSISDELHEELLKESLHEFNEIWRSLAQK